MNKHVLFLETIHFLFYLLEFVIGGYFCCIGSDRLDRIGWRQTAIAFGFIGSGFIVGIHGGFNLVLRYLV